MHHAQSYCYPSKVTVFIIITLRVKAQSFITLRVKAQSFNVTQVLSIFLLFLFRHFLNGYNFWTVWAIELIFEPLTQVLSKIHSYIKWVIPISPFGVNECKHQIA